MLFEFCCHSLAAKVSVIDVAHDRKMLETVRYPHIHLPTNCYNFSFVNFLRLQTQTTNHILQSVYCNTIRRSFEAAMVALNSENKPFHREMISNPKLDFV